MNIIKTIKTPINWLYSNYQESQEPRRLKNLYSQFAKAGDLVFDIGANKGEHSKVMTKLGFKVIAVEPNPDYKERLSKIAYAVESVGVASKSGVLNYHCFKETGHNTFMDYKLSDKFKEQIPLRTIEVPIVTLKELIDKWGVPKFIKIDVEGFEYEVLKTLDVLIDYIAFEYTPSEMKTANYCIAYLELLGYEFNYSKSIFHKLLSSKWLSGEDLIFNINKVNLFGMIYARRKI